MKTFHLALFGSFIAIAACVSPKGTGAEQLFRSCDLNADSALNPAEFAGCLVQTSRQQRMAAQRSAVSRSKIQLNSVNEAVMSNDLRAAGAQLQKHSARSMKFGKLRNNDVFINRLISILQHIGNTTYGDALNELVSLVSTYELETSSEVTLTLAVMALYEENYDLTVNYLISIISDVATGSDTASSSTVINFASLLKSVIYEDSANINFYLNRSLFGLIEDFSTINGDAVIDFVGLLHAVIKKYPSEFQDSLEKIFDIPDLSTETINALRELNNTFVNGQYSDLSNKVFDVLNSVLENENETEILTLSIAAMKALAYNNFEEAIKQLTLLYARISIRLTCASSFRSSTILTFAAVVNALLDEDNATAVAQIDLLKQNIENGLSYSQSNFLGQIVEKIAVGENYEVIADLAGLAGSLCCRSGVEITPDLFTALSSVAAGIKDSYDANAMIAAIEEILSSSSITQTVEIKSALRALITVVSEETNEDALVTISVIMTGSKRAFDRMISPQVAVQVERSLAGIDNGNISTSIAIVEALLRGENGGASLSIVVRDDLKKVLKALETDNMSVAYSLLTVIAVGDRQTSVTSLATAALVSVIHALSTGSPSVADFAKGKLTPLLADDDLEPFFKWKIQGIIDDINDLKYARALTDTVKAILESQYFFTESVYQSLFKVVQLAISGNTSEAIEIVQGLVKNLNGDLQLLLGFFNHLLAESKSYGAIIVLNVIISEAA